MRLRSILVILAVLISCLVPHGYTLSRSFASETGSKKVSDSVNIIQDGEVIKFLKTFSKSYKEGNIDEYMTFFTANVLENGANNFEKIKTDYLHTITHHIITVHEFEVSDIKNQGDSVMVDALYNKTLTEKSKGDAFEINGNVRLKILKEGDQLRIAAIDYDKYIKYDYIIGSEDILEISVWKSPDLSSIIMVRPDGMISLPLIGDIQANNRYAKDLKEEIGKKLLEYKQDPIVSVIVKEVNSQAVFVTGEVIRPGKYPLRSETSIVQAITLAGGFSQWADKDKIVVIRKSPLKPEGNRIVVRYSDIVSGKNMKANILLKAGDTIIVP